MEKIVSPVLILSIVAIYFLLLSIVSYLTSRKASNETFFTADKKSPWILVAIGMVGASLSGVTFISIPGLVGAGGGNQAFSYMQMVMGYLVGYGVIAFILMPLYYKWKLTSIYTYLGKRLGTYSHKTAAAFFLVSRAVGAALRLFLVAIVFQKFVMDHFGIPFVVTVASTILLVWVYTYRGGIKTIVWTDTIQTVTMLAAVGFTIYSIMHAMDMTWIGMWTEISDAGYNKLFFFDEGWNDKNNFFKQFLSGALIATAMTGLDQDMMQKNLTCNSLASAKKNILVFSIFLVIANVVFLTLGALLYLYAQHIGLEMPDKSDQLYPLLALTKLPVHIGVLFVVGLIAAAYSSADSALTSLTTSFCMDFLDYENNDWTEGKRKSTRIIVHVGFSVLLLCIIMIVYGMDNPEAIVNNLFTAAGYTYGPILGLFVFSIYSKRKIKDLIIDGKNYRDILTIFIAFLAIFLTYLLNTNSADWFGGFSFGHTILALNGLLMILGLTVISTANKESH